MHEDARELTDIGLDCWQRPQQMLPQAAAAWTLMQHSANIDGITLQPVSAFRSINYQSRLIKRNQALLAEVNQKAVIEELNRQLNSKIDQLTKMMMINERISRLTDNEAVFTEAVRLGAELTSAEKVSLMIYDRNVEHLAIRAAIAAQGWTGVTLITDSNVGAGLTAGRLRRSGPRPC